MGKTEHRTLLTGKKVREYKEVADLKIISRCPKKWAFVDLEVGNIWLIDNSSTKSYIAADNATIAAIHKITEPS